MKRMMLLAVVILTFCAVNYFSALTYERVAKAEWSIFILTTCSLMGILAIWGTATAICYFVSAPPQPTLPRKKKWHVEFSELSFYRLGQRLKLKGGQQHG